MPSQSILQQRPASLLPFAMESSQPVDPNHELTKAFLFLQTASTAVEGMAQIVKATDDYMIHAALDYNPLFDLHDKRTDEKEQLDMWKERLLEAQVGFVDWAARRALRPGLALPSEILKIVEGYLRQEGSLDVH